MKPQTFSTREAALIVDALLHKAKDDRALAVVIAKAGSSACARCAECSSSPVPCAACCCSSGLAAIMDHASLLEAQAKEMEVLADSLDGA